MTKIFKIINNAFDLKTNDPLVIALLKIPLSLLFGIISILVVSLVTYVKELNHYLLFLKNKEGHQTKGLKVEIVGNMVKSEYIDECSCDRKGCSKNIFEIVEKTIIETCNSL